MLPLTLVRICSNRDEPLDRLSRGTGNVYDDYVRKRKSSWRILTAMKPYYPKNRNAHEINATQASTSDLSK